MQRAGPRKIAKAYLLSISIWCGLLILPALRSPQSTQELPIADGIKNEVGDHARIGYR
jgi:hypothetical protein